MIIETKQIMLGKIPVDVLRKDIKHLHLSVHPPTGRVRISAPSHMKLDTVRVFAITKLGWIKKQQNKFRGQGRESRRDYVSRESHFYLGKRYLLKVIENGAAPRVMVKHDNLELYVRPNTGIRKREEILQEWYRQRLKEFVPNMIAKYEKAMKVKVADFGIKRMKTKWGTCSRQARRIWLNLELAKKPKHFIEYVVVHEMAHLLERRHNGRFTAYLDEFMPQWRHYKEELNRAPLGHVNWNY